MRKNNEAAAEDQTLIHDLAGKKDLFLIAALIIAFGITTAFFFGFEAKPMATDDLQQLRATLLQEGLSATKND